MKCVVTARVLAVCAGQGHALPPPYNVTDPVDIEETRDFVQRALAAPDPSDLHLPPKLSQERQPDGRYVITIGWRDWPRIRKAEVAPPRRPAMVVRRVGEDIWEIDFD